jgi:methionyl aminopeptidase
MHAANQVVATVRDEVVARVAPGVTTGELDSYAEARVRELGGVPAFKGYRGFPATLCLSLNEEVVHGIPSTERRLAPGDILGIDLGVKLEGYYGDSAITVPVGTVEPEVSRLLAVTEASLQEAIRQCVPGNRIGDISAAVQQYVEAQGFSIVRDFVGHGIGKSLHEDPQVPNFGDAGVGPRLRPGMVLAIEPMVNMGLPGVEVLEDGWTAVAADRRPSAHFEHSIAVTEEGPWVLSLTEQSVVASAAGHRDSMTEKQI